MLSSLRQTMCRALPQLAPRYTRLNSSSTPSSNDNAIFKEAMGVFAMGDGLIVPELPPPETPKPDFDNMHHHIPPAQSPLLQLFTNMIMSHGQYALAAKTTSQTLLNIHALTRSPPMPIFEHAILTASPAVRCKRQKEKGGKATLKPMALSERQRTRIGISWIVEAAKRPGNPGRTHADRLARELLAVVKGTSPVLKKKSEMHEAAVQNRYVGYSSVSLLHTLTSSPFIFKRCFVQATVAFQVEVCKSTLLILFVHYATIFNFEIHASVSEDMQCQSWFNNKMIPIGIMAASPQNQNNKSIAI